MTPNQTLIAAGEALFGSRWQTDLSAALGVNDRTVRRWVAHSEVPRPSVLEEIRILVEQRRRRLVEIEAEIVGAFEGADHTGNCG